MNKMINLVLIQSIALFCFVSCVKNKDVSRIDTQTITNESIKKTDITNKMDFNNRGLNQQEKDFLYGKWQVKNFLGYPVHYTDGRISDDCIIDKIITIESDYYSSSELNEYSINTLESISPIYEIRNIYKDSTEFYRSQKIESEILKTSHEEQIKHLEVFTSPPSNSDSFFIIDNNRLIFCLAGTELFELEKVQ